MATKTLVPYNFSFDLQVRARDPYDPTQEDLELSWVNQTEGENFVQVMDLASSAVSWRRLTIELHATLAQAELDKLLPESSRPESDTELVVSVRCPATKYRRGVRLDSIRKGVWTGAVTVDRSDVSTTVELHPALVRSTNIPGDNLEGYARDRGAVIAEGRAIRLLIDTTTRSVKGAPKTAWEDFRTSDHSWRKAHSGDLLFFDPDSDDPTLWLNSSYSELREILHGTVEAGASAAMRQLLNLLVAQMVWSQAFLVAIGSVGRDDGGDPEMPTGWRGAVLAGLLPRLLPDAGTEADRLVQAVEMLGSPEQVGNLSARIASATMDHLKSGRIFKEAIRAIERESAE